jgi:hypothetical protein
MALEITELPQLLKDIPKGAWVAISLEQHKVLAYGDDTAEIVESAKAQGENLPLIVRVPEQNISLFL